MGQHEFTLKDGLVVVISEGNESSLMYKVLMALVKKGKCQYSYAHRHYPH